MIWLLLLAVWVPGLVAVPWPVFQRLIAHAKHMYPTVGLDGIDYLFSAAGATFAAVFWPIGLPLLLSCRLWTGSWLPGWFDDEDLEDARHG